MDTKVYFSIRNGKTHEHMGWKLKYGNLVISPILGELENFILEYNAVNNYDMGNAVELYDVDKQVVDHFAILYSFKCKGLTTLKDNFKYEVLEAEVKNLEMLEIIDKHNKKEFLNVDPTVDLSPKQ
jgi:hypothetical protein